MEAAEAGEEAAVAKVSEPVALHADIAQMLLEVWARAEGEFELNMRRVLRSMRDRQREVCLLFFFVFFLLALLALLQGRVCAQHAPRVLRSMRDRQREVCLPFCTRFTCFTCFTAGKELDGRLPLLLRATSADVC
jgi:hypothetical protein